MDLLKIYTDKQLIEDKPSQTTDQFSEKEITPKKFNSILLNKIHPFYDKNDRNFC